MREGGIEPPIPFGNGCLRPARLPVPPLSRADRPRSYSERSRGVHMQEGPLLAPRALVRLSGQNAPMNGPEILARSLSRPWIVDRAGGRWQYHSRSDRHAKIAYWCILFDLFRTSALLRDRAAAGDLAVAFRQTDRGPQGCVSKRLGPVLGRAADASSLPG